MWTAIKMFIFQRNFHLRNLLSTKPKTKRVHPKAKPCGAQEGGSHEGQGRYAQVHNVRQVRVAEEDKCHAAYQVRTILVLILSKFS